MDSHRQQQRTPSPTSTHVSRRRKKRTTPTSSIPGSSLTGLNRSSIRVVELARGVMGYGFTISGQKPCLLRCIVEDSPAEEANLRPGNCLVGVNGRDVSHLAHDDVVRLIRACTGVLKLHIADSYFSESSDDEGLKLHQPRPKYPHRLRGLNKGSSRKSLVNGKDNCLAERMNLKNMSRSAESLISPPARYSSWDQLERSPRRHGRPIALFDNEGFSTPLRKASGALNIDSCAYKENNHPLDMVRVLAHLDDQHKKPTSQAKSMKPPEPPPPPKPKVEVNPVQGWADSIEKLLADSAGLDVFTVFLEHEFSAENIHFYRACQNYKKSFEQMTQKQRASEATSIFERFLQNGATDPVNVDFQARCQVEKLLSEPLADLFDLPLSQVFNLLKFDCYPRFLRSDVYRDALSEATQVPSSVGDPTDSDQESVKSHKLQADNRRRSLLPWNIKGRSKNKTKSRSDVDCLNSDISFIQHTAMTRNYESSDQDDGLRRQSCKLCRVILPDNSTTVLPCKPGETLCSTVQRLLEKREFHYSAFEVVSVSTGKALDLNMEVMDMTAREIKVEPRAFLGIELPLGWRVGVRANPGRKLAEVLKPILSQHSLKLDAVLVFDLETGDLLDMKRSIGVIDGHNVQVKLKDSKPEVERLSEYKTFDHAAFEDDRTSTRTSSSQASSNAFRGFLRRSSKKYKKKQAHTIESVPSESDGHVPSDNGVSIIADNMSSTSSAKYSEIDVQITRPLTHVTNVRNMNGRLPDSPLSLISSDIKLVKTSRNRNPIYVTQSLDSVGSY